MAHSNTAAGPGERENMACTKCSQFTAAQQQDLGKGIKWHALSVHGSQQQDLTAAGPGERDKHGMH